MQSDTLLQFLLTRTHADVKIRLKEGNSPVNNAEVQIGDESVITSSLGLAKFLQLPVDQSYHYSVSKEAYVFKEGDFLLSTDTTIDVSMEKLASGTSAFLAGTDIRLWPNPTTGLIYMEHPEPDPGIVQILDLNGAVLCDFILKGRESRLDISSLPGGVYILSIPGNGGSFRKLITKL